jgi:NADPH:quinone reductase
VRGYVTDPGAPGGLRFADDLPRPEPADHEAVVEVRAYAVNRGELTLLGMRDDGWRPGQDVAGVVVQAAADGSGPREGTRVVAVAEGAGWSERIALPTGVLAPIADSVSFEQAASLPIAGLTALRALRVVGPVLGGQVLVTGATGGVGQFAIQLAVASGAEVTAQVSSTERADLVRELGAHRVVVDLDGEDVGPFDGVLDGVGGEVLTAAVHRSAAEATVATYGTVGGRAELGYLDFRSAPNARVVGLSHAYPEATRGQDLAILAELVAAGRLTPHLGLVDDWVNTREALDALDQRQVRGRVVLTIS